MKALKAILVSISLLFTVIMPIAPAKAQEAIYGWLPCSVSNEAPCIQSLSYVNEKGVRIEGKLSGRSRNLTRIIALKNYPFTDYEWSLPGLKQPNGTDRMLLTAYYFPKNFPYCWLPDQDVKTCDYGIDQLTFSVTPSWWDSQPPPTHFENSDRDNLCGTKEFPSVCIGPWSMNGDVSYEIIAKMPKGFDARMLIGEGASGDLKFSTDSSGNRLFTLLAKPAMKSFVWNISQRPINYKDADKADLSGYSLDFFIHSSSAVEPQWFSRCDKGEGLSVWHNSSERSAPYWISSEQSLAMYVSSIHKRMDGSINAGTFQIQMPVTVAQCLWGVDLSKATAATISAVYGEGNASEIVTTSAKVENGFYYLSANGFHYSSPTIKVKLTQTADTQVQNKPSEIVEPKTNTIQPVVKKKITITCSKGKLTRNVTAYEPKCPSGYKKVA
jgi:hypothetical protein